MVDLSAREMIDSSARDFPGQIQYIHLQCLTKQVHLAADFGLSSQRLLGVLGRDKGASPVQAVITLNFDNSCACQACNG